LLPLSLQLSPFVPQSNITPEAIDMVVHDIRGKEDTVSLDKTGFQFVCHVSQEKEFIDEGAITTRYYDEVVELLKKHTASGKSAASPTLRTPP
jgi:hypothetical protein